MNYLNMFAEAWEKEAGLCFRKSWEKLSRIEKGDIPKEMFSVYCAYELYIRGQNLKYIVAQLRQPC